MGWPFLAVVATTVLRRRFGVHGREQKRSGKGGWNSAGGGFAAVGFLKIVSDLENKGSLGPKNDPTQAKTRLEWAPRHFRQCQFRPLPSVAGLALFPLSCPRYIYLCFFTFFAVDIDVLLN